MHKMKRLILLFIILCSLSALNITKAQNNKVTYNFSESRDFEPRQGVVVTPLLADLQVITQTSVRDSVIFPILVASISQNQITSWAFEYKKIAMSFLLKKYKADAIIGSMTDVSTTSDGRMMISISGYPAKYTNFRNATSADVWMIPLFGIIEKNTTGTFNTQETKTVLIK